jgi:hypothetical protein
MRGATGVVGGGCGAECRSGGGYMILDGSRRRRIERLRLKNLIVSDGKKR